MDLERHIAPFQGLAGRCAAARLHLDRQREVKFSIVRLKVILHCLHDGQWEITTTLDGDRFVQRLSTVGYQGKFDSFDFSVLHLEFAPAWSNGRNPGTFTSVAARFFSKR